MHAAAVDDPVRRFFEVLPRPLRFLGVGGLGLITDLAIFTLVIAHGLNPLGARLISLTFATLVTWRLNRALTFDRSGRRTADEAMRYAAVATATQAMSYGIFAVLVVTLLAPIPQLAVIGGAAAGAVVSYLGQALFAFRPRRSA
ncbi:MAG: GtrA family protein [Xanthobacteraceae bacterium]